MIRGFTLVELAIVIVIAGILAAVSLPIYQGIIQRAKWSEAKAAVGTIKDAFEVMAAEESRTLTSYTGSDGAGAIVWNDLGLVQTEFDSDNFANIDYTMAALVKATATYTIQCGPSSVGGGPQEIYTVDQNGIPGGTAP